ncbi:uncharacterized protein BXZ73DRAFT_77136 [Epithele typhae]|uniref:uncharacterized protein n=1 Tax=Epithele typhae TaxID=378194 RepID=UPI002008767D|nr:uncharacterized protein BXZ73DRAFT_77136 [Epithele typhae]KAH9934043.1 hypothetical protein BXZ73DRAFT_77136 [Epithele typhae]
MALFQNTTVSVASGPLLPQYHVVSSADGTGICVAVEIAHDSGKSVTVLIDLSPGPLEAPLLQISAKETEKEPSVADASFHAAEDLSETDTEMSTLSSKRLPSERIRPFSTPPSLHKFNEDRPDTPPRSQGLPPGCKHSWRKPDAEALQHQDEHRKELFVEAKKRQLLKEMEEEEGYRAVKKERSGASVVTAYQQVRMHLVPAGPVALDTALPKRARAPLGATLSRDVRTPAPQALPPELAVSDINYYIGRRRGGDNAEEEEGDMGDVNAGDAEAGDAKASEAEEGDAEGSRGGPRRGGAGGGQRGQCEGGGGAEQRGRAMRVEGRRPRGRRRWAEEGDAEGSREEAEAEEVRVGGRVRVRRAEAGDEVGSARRGGRRGGGRAGGGADASVDLRYHPVAISTPITPLPQARTRTSYGRPPVLIVPTPRRPSIFYYNMEVARHGGWRRKKAPWTRRRAPRTKEGDAGGGRGGERCGGGESETGEAESWDDAEGGVDAKEGKAEGRDEVNKAEGDARGRWRRGGRRRRRRATRAEASETEEAEGDAGDDVGDTEGSREEVEGRTRAEEGEVGAGQRRMMGKGRTSRMRTVTWAEDAEVEEGQDVAEEGDAMRATQRRKARAGDAGGGERRGGGRQCGRPRPVVGRGHGWASGVQEDGAEDSPKNKCRGTSPRPPYSDLHRMDVLVQCFLLAGSRLRLRSREVGGGKSGEARGSEGGGEEQEQEEASEDSNSEGRVARINGPVDAHHASAPYTKGGASAPADKYSQQVFLAIHCCSEVGNDAEVADARGGGGPRVREAEEGVRARAPENSAEVGNGEEGSGEVGQADAEIEVKAGGRPDVRSRRGEVGVGNAGGWSGGLTKTRAAVHPRNPLILISMLRTSGWTSSCGADAAGKSLSSAWTVVGAEQEEEEAGEGARTAGGMRGVHHSHASLPPTEARLRPPSPSVAVGNGGTTPSCCRR